MSPAAFDSGHGLLAIERTMDVRREEYLEYMTFQSNDRPLFTELFGPIIGLKDEWRAQGASADELDFSAFQFRQPLYCGVPVNTGWLGGDPETLLEETEDYAIIRDSMGRRRQLFKGIATIALPLDYPVRTMTDWLKIKHHYAFSEERFSSGWRERVDQARDDGYVITVSMPGGFDQPRQLLGEENICLAFYDQPELIHDMLSTMGDTTFAVLERVTRDVNVDVLTVHEDMAGKSGSLAGPAQIAEFIKPYYRRIWDMVHARGAQLFDQDSDGNMNGVIDAFLDCGLNCMHPLEPAAGMDIVELRERYGKRLAFRGGLDKHVLRRGKDAIDVELQRKVPAMIRSGGCVLSLDHRIPNGTPLEAYRYYQRRMWELLEP